MSYNGSGTFQINSSGQPVITGTTISSTVFNALTADLATGLSTAMTKDGQTTTTARIPFALGINSTLVTDATSITTGSIITAGGVGISKALYVGTTANVAGAVTLGGVATFSAQPIFSSLTASSAVATNASKGLVSVTNTGTGNNVLATSPTIATPSLTSPTISDGTTNGVGYLNGSKVLTTGSTLSFDGTTLSTSGLTASGTITASGGTANGVAYLNGSKVLTTGSALSFDGTSLVGTGKFQSNLVRIKDASYSELYFSTADAGGNGVFSYEHSTNSLRTYVNGGIKTVIDSSGNVGIGTTTPSGKLDVLRSSTSTTAFDESVIRAINSGAATLNQRVDIGMRFQDGTYNGTGGISMIRESATARSGALSFSSINSSGDATNAMRLDSSSNLLFNSGYGSAAVAYGCRAWVNFNGTGTVAIRASGNVSSITDNSIGNFTVNITTAMPDTNAATFGSAVRFTATASMAASVFTNITSTSTVRVLTGYEDTFSGANSIDPEVVSVSVFR